MAGKPMQKSLEVRTPLVQNGADEHGPDRGDITAEWAHIGRLNGVFGKVDGSPFPEDWRFFRPRKGMPVD